MKKVKIIDFWSKMWKNDLHLDRQKAFGFDFKNFESISKAFYQWFVKKVKNETDATFSHVYDVFASKFCHFSHLSSKMKVNHVFKAKMEAFRERNPQKVKNDQKLLHLAFVFPLQMKSTFLCPQARNLAQTNGFIAVLLEHDFDDFGVAKVKFLSRSVSISKAF